MTLEIESSKYLETSRERFTKIFCGQCPDRMPVTLFIHDHGHFLSQMYPNLDTWDWAARQARVVELQKQLGCDVFVRIASFLDDPGFMSRGELDVVQQTDTWQVQIEVCSSGHTRTQLATINTPDGILTQETTLQEVGMRTYVYACTKPAIKSPSDLAIAMAYEPPPPETWKKQVRERVQYIQSLVGDSGIVGMWTTGGPFNNVSRLVKLDDLYMLFLVDYPFYQQLMNFALRRIQAFYDVVAGSGVDVFIIGGNVPGGFLGRQSYERYVLPFEKQCVEIFQGQGAPAILHNCGKIMDLVESYKALGVRVVEPFSPPPTLGDANLEHSIDVIRGNYAVVGGIDQVNVLKNGSVNDVKRVTEQTIAIGKSTRQRGLFILQSADFLEYGTPVENVEAYVKTALEFAAY